MKHIPLIFLILMILVVGCGTPMTKTSILWKGEPKSAVDKMLFALEELGFEILNVNKDDGKWEL